MNDNIKQKVYQRLGVDIKWLRDLPNTEITYPISQIGNLVDFIVELARNEEKVKEGWRRIIEIDSKADGSLYMNIADGFTEKNVKICFEAMLKEINDKGLNLSENPDKEQEVKHG